MAKIKYKIKESGFEDFTNKLKDLSNIDDSVRLKIDKDHMLMYSVLGNNILLAFKNFLVKTSDFMEIPDDMDYQIDMIIPNVKKFVKNLDIVKETTKIKLEINYRESPDDKEVYNVRYFQIAAGKFKINWVGGEHTVESRDINKDMLDKNLNISNRKWHFSLNNEDFTDIKKLSNINSDRIINISIDKGVVNFSEQSAWDLEVDKLEDDRDASLIINKRFLKCINDMDVIEFSIFETFMLIKDGNSNLMLSFEQDFDEEEYD